MIKRQLNWICIPLLFDKTIPKLLYNSISIHEIELLRNSIELNSHFGRGNQYGVERKANKDDHKYFPTIKRKIQATPRGHWQHYSLIINSTQIQLDSNHSILRFHSTKWLQQQQHTNGNRPSRLQSTFSLQKPLRIFSNSLAKLVSWIRSLFQWKSSSSSDSKRS